MQSVALHQSQAHQFATAFGRFVNDRLYDVRQAGAAHILLTQQRKLQGQAVTLGGGILLDLFSHLVDQTVLMFGPVETVYAELAAHTTTAEDTAFLSCRHESGVVAHLGATSVSAAPGPRVRLLGDRAAYLIGAQRDEETAFTEWQPADADHIGWLVRGSQREPVRGEHGDQADFYREVAVALRQDDPQAAMPVDPHDAVHVLAVLDAARVSAAGGRVVDVFTPGDAP